MLGNVATGVMIAGGVIAAAGVVLWLTAPSDEPVAAAAKTSPQIGLGVGPGRASLRIRF